MRIWFVRQNLSPLESPFMTKIEAYHDKNTRNKSDFIMYSNKVNAQGGLNGLNMNGRLGRNNVSFFF